MTAVLWLPVMSVVERSDGRESEADSQQIRHWEGYIPIKNHQCARIFRQGWISLREFTAMDRTRTFRLPETANDLIVELSDLVVLEAERKRMETKYPGLANVERCSTVPDARDGGSPSAHLIDPTYRIVQVGGREHRFGEMQAKILRLLAEAARKGEPWQSGKTLLRDAGSQGFSLSNLFKRHPVWRELIASNQRGFYRLSDQFVEQLAVASGRASPGRFSSTDFS